MIPIRCSYTDLASPGELRPHPLNPKGHPADQVALYRRVIESAGWRRPVVVSKRSGRITRGHGAVQAALSAGWDQVPVDYQDYADESSEVADMLADNRLAEMGVIDDRLLGDALRAVAPEALELTAFDKHEIERALRDTIQNLDDSSDWGDDSPAADGPQAARTPVTVTGTAIDREGAVDAVNSLLTIPLTRADLNRFRAFRERGKFRSDTAALLALLENPPC